MNALQLAMFLLVGAGGTLTVFTRDPLRQALVFALYGTLMTILFVVIEAGDVALSELAVGTAATPLMLLVALASVRNSKK
ncbi:MAG: Na(+)/H(+) antiporter subunit B [Chthoniobacterales bacterium]